MIKKIITGVVALAAVFAIVATASAASYMFSANLTVGSTGADVVALQSFLQSKGVLTMPAGVSMGYFGGLTKAALAAYQVSQGITPAVGYFGPLTRASVNADAGVAVVPVCPVGFTCTSNSTGGSTTGTTEGTLDVTLSGSPSNNGNIQSSIDVPVYGLTLRARIADVTVDRADLQIAVDNAGSTENPATLINTIKLWDGSNVVKTWNVTSADFTKDVNDSSVYYVRLSNLGVTVAKDTTKNIVFSFSTNSGIDTTRTVTIQGYGSNSLRVVSGNNITSYFDISGSGFTRTQTFKKPGTGNVVLSSDPDTFGFGNYRFSPTSGIDDADIALFKVKGDGGSPTITDITVNVTASGTMPSTISLYDGDTKIDSKIGASLVTFSNLSIPLENDVYKELGFKVDMPSDTEEETTVSIGDATTTIVYEKPNGSVASVTSNELALYPSYFYSATPQFTVDAGPTSVTTATNDGHTTSITGNFTLTVNPLGSTMTALQSGDITVQVGEDPSNLVTLSDVTFSTTPNDTVYAEDGTYKVNVTANAYNTDLPTTGTYIFYLTGVNWSMGNGVAVNQSYDFDNLTYHSAPVTFIK